MSNFKYTLVDTEDTLAIALESLSLYREVAFDCEGVELGRHGPLTVACFLGIPSEDMESSEPVPAPTAYVVDVLLLGGKRVFARGAGLCELLENSSVLKITFDCRADSDAVYHQFGVRMNGCLDCQVLDQGVRLTNGEPLPQSGSFATYVTGMAKAAQRYLSSNVMRQLGGSTDNGPHKTDPQVWAKRPMVDTTVAYAAYDVHIIRLLLHKMRAARVLPGFMRGVEEHSERYVRYFRDRPTPISWPKDKRFILQEHPIVSSATFDEHRSILRQRALEKRAAEHEEMLARAKKSAEEAKIARAQREIRSSAAVAEAALKEATSKKAKLTAIREAVVSGAYLVNLDRALAVADARLVTLTDKHIAAVAAVAQLPPGAASTDGRGYIAASELRSASFIHQCGGYGSPYHGGYHARDDSPDNSPDERDYD